LFIIGPAILFIILCVLLPELLCLFVAGLVGYIICKQVNRRSIGLMIITVTVFCALNLVVGRLKPIVDAADKAPVNKEQLQESQKYLDRKLDGLSDNKYFQYIITPPR